MADFWGELCASKEAASAWADRLVGITRMALSPDKDFHGHFHGTSACFSALYRAERHEEIVDILQVDAIWPYKIWAVKALAAMGRTQLAASGVNHKTARSTPPSLPLLDELRTFCYENKIEETSALLDVIEDCSSRSRVRRPESNGETRGCPWFL